MSRRWKDAFDVRQLQISWDPDPPALRQTKPTSGSPSPAVPQAVAVATDALAQKLPWDFRTTFPSPLPEAIEQGVISEDDADEQNIAALHREHAQQMTAALRDMDAVLEARRLGVDLRSGRPPATQAGRERLKRQFDTEPMRLRRWYQTLLSTYEEVFGFGARGAFDKAVRAWHAGIDVKGPSAGLEDVAGSPPPRPAPCKLHHRGPRVVSRLPMPKPLPEAVAAGDFGIDEDGEPIRPRPDEVREITTTHAEKLIDLLDEIQDVPQIEKTFAQQEFNTGIALYAQSFGEPAARRLQAYVVRQCKLQHGVAAR